MGAAIVLVLALAIPNRAQAAAEGCGQAQVEKLLGAPPPPGPSAHYISPREEITPFYQWENNDGYCGEVSLISSGLINGQWMSQYNARLICGAFFGPESLGSGASLLQAGNPISRVPNYNAQLLIEDPGTGVSGDYDFSHASLCGANSRLVTVTYPYETGFATPNVGRAGYQDYMHWVKAQVMDPRVYSYEEMLDHCPQHGVAAAADADAVCAVGGAGRRRGNPAAPALHPQPGRPHADRHHRLGQIAGVSHARHFAAIARTATRGDAQAREMRNGPARPSADGPSRSTPGGAAGISPRIALVLGIQSLIGGAHREEIRRAGCARRGRCRRLPGMVVFWQPRRPTSTD